MHPERAAEVQREIVIGAAARRNGWRGNARDAILLPRRGEAMPMDQAWLIDMVLDSDAERPANFRGNTSSSIRLAYSKNRGRFAIDLDRAPLKPQHGRWGLGRFCACQGGDAGCKRSCQEIAAREHDRSSYLIVSNRLFGSNAGLPG